MANVGEKPAEELSHESDNSRQATTDRLEVIALKPIFKNSLKNPGLGEKGCEHYRRRCRIRAPCCNAVFSCRHCHNEHQAQVEKGKAGKEHHELPRHRVEKVICSMCDFEQEVQQFCSRCGVCMGQYFCSICKFYDDDTSKLQFHCAECGICRVGGRDKYFHCKQCGCCYHLNLRDNHKCIDNAMHHNCPICFEFLFDSLQATAVLKCGHTLHTQCLDSLLGQPHRIPSCPVCSKSIGDLATLWARMDEQVAQTPMPDEYKNKEVPILCNDCGVSSVVLFHVIGLKCKSCGSYNTRQ